jgi:hypothetical protein
MGESVCTFGEVRHNFNFYMVTVSLSGVCIERRGGEIYGKCLEGSAKQMYRRNRLTNRRCEMFSDCETPTAL